MVTLPFWSVADVSTPHAGSYVVEDVQPNGAVFVTVSEANAPLPAGAVAAGT